jgi:hypothetical protein
MAIAPESSLVSRQSVYDGSMSSRTGSNPHEHGALAPAIMMEVDSHEKMSLFPLFH